MDECAARSRANRQVGIAKARAASQESLTAERRGRAARLLKEARQQSASLLRGRSRSHDRGGSSGDREVPSSGSQPEGRREQLEDEESEAATPGGAKSSGALGCAVPSPLESPPSCPMHAAPLATGDSLRWRPRQASVDSPIEDGWVSDPLWSQRQRCPSAPPRAGVPCRARAGGA
ncbi:unnamed protein product [Polarella glacialis]|uniref:Uncharacterized protein n=1 Tax=Polarella glacialis TaxID=89957 RepID=A0A813I868_POLGL|nr:unnamed protein product [Polarella glacialis]